jgi:hypothetical protein
MTRTRLAAFTTCAVALVGGVAVLWGPQALPTAGPDVGGSPATAGAGPGRPGHADTRPGKPSSAGSSGRSASPQPGGPGTASRSHSALAGVEVLPEQPGDSGVPAVPAIRGTVAGSNRGVAVAPRSVVSGHTRSRSGDAVQVALTASSAAGPDAILRYYRIRLSRLGFTEGSVPAVGGSTAASFRHGRDSVVVTVTPAGAGGVTYTVLGILHSGRA